MKRILDRILNYTVAVILITAAGLDVNAVRIHSAADTVRVNSLITMLGEPGGKVSDKMARVAEALRGSRYAETTKNDSIATVEINLSEFDDIDFLNCVVAMSKTLVSPNPRWREYLSNLENVSRRRGVDKGFVSKMIYGGDWVVDNVYRGNVKELTEYDNNPNFKTKSLDYATRHREEYKALADSAIFEDMRMVEMGFRTHKIPHLKKEWANRPDILSEIRNGDIIMLLTNDTEQDIYLSGIVVMREDGQHLIYVSKEAGQVMEDPQPLFRQIKKETKRIYGWRWLRAAD